MKKKKNVLIKELLVEMKKSFPRFLSILIMVFLGVGFYSGICATGPDMQRSADAFYDETSLMDIRIYGDLGLTEDDVTEIQKIDGIDVAEGRYTYDVFWTEDGENRPIKLMSYSDYMDFPAVKEGRLPQQSGECLLDERLAEVYGCKIGDTLSLKSGTEDDISDVISCDTYKVVGIGDSSYYLSHERGTTTIGNGELKGFLVVPKEDFTLEVFTEITATVAGTKDLLCYDDDYESKVSGTVDEIEAIADGRCETRYQDIKTEAEEKIADGEKEIADAEKELADAKDKLTDARKEVEDGKKEIEKNEALLTKNEKKLADSEKELKAGKEELEKGKKQIASTKKELETVKANLVAANLPLDQYEAGMQEVEKNEKALNQSEKELKQAEKELKAGKKELEKGKKKLAKAKQELEDGETELTEAEEEFKEKSAEAEVDIADAKKKLKDAKEEVADLEMPEWYVLDRGSVQTYAEFEQDSMRISAIGNVVPILFFLVAALVCLTTMTRMIGEDRTQIGVLKALGYSRYQISMKYMVYSLSSTFIGSLIGVLVGQKALPYIIMRAYGLLYENIPGFLMPIHPKYTIISFFIAVGCILFATYAACNKSLKEVPAQLMRPVAPKAGKKILLEKIPFLWKCLNFSQKAAIRNLVRYKKRLVMTVFGIGGCMALLLTGFGIQDSIMAIGDLQYGNVQLYDRNILMDKEATEEEKAELIRRIEEDDRITDYVLVREAAVDASTDADEVSATFLVAKDTKLFETFFKFTDRLTGEEYHLDDEGVIIDEKLATLLDVVPGDEITLKEGDEKSYQVKVSAVMQNYFYHYIHMTPSLYEKIHGEEPEYQSIYLEQVERNGKMEAAIREDYMDLSMVSGISFVSDANENISDMLKSMDVLIYVIILAAGMLAFVVLYNLNNINIGERKRELATLKVLGFYDMEVSWYIFRENVMITILGMIAGVFLGIFLHRFVILTVETDILMFSRKIMPMSYLYSVGFTGLFSFLVNGFMHFKMKKIDMIESLKSVE